MTMPFPFYSRKRTSVVQPDLPKPALSGLDKWEEYEADEGLETAVFLLATFQASDNALTAGIGALLGLCVAVVIGYGIYRGGVHINLARFFRLTGLVLSCAAEAGLATLDLFETIDEAVRARGLRTVYVKAHPSPIGTEIAARRIAAALKQHRIPPP